MAKEKVTADGIPVHCAHDKIVPVSSLKPHPKNPNTHPEGQLEALGGIIAEQGWRGVVTVSNRSGFIVTGHGRRLAAIMRSLKEIPVEYQDFESDEAELAHMLADNRLAELAETDYQKLKDVLQDIDTGALDMGLTGYDAETLENLMAPVGPPPRVEALGDKAPPKMSWALIGIELSRFHEISELTKSAAEIPGAVVIVVANDNEVE